MTSLKTLGLHRPLLWLSVALLVFSSVLWVKAWNQTVASFHPQLSFDVGNPVALNSQITLQGLSSPAACEAALIQVSGSIRAACPQCRVVQRACPTQDTTGLAAFFGGAPQAMVVGHFMGGLIRYQAADDAQALNACELAASGSSKAPLNCFAPNASRPALPLVAAPAPTDGLADGDAYGLLALLAALLVALQMAQAPLRALGHSLVRLPTAGKQLTLAGFDLVLVWAALWLAMAIRLETLSPFAQGANLVPFLLGASIICLPVFYWFGLYKTVVRFIGLVALVAIAKAVLVATGLNVLLLQLIHPEGLPRSVPVIHGLLLLLGIGGSRALARYWLSSEHRLASGRKPVLIYGAGSAGRQLASALSHSAEFRPVALVDDSPTLRARQVTGLTVHAPNEIDQLIDKYLVEEILLALPSAGLSRRKAILKELENFPVKVRTLPGVAGIAEGKVKVSDLRDVQIEDLLGRDPVPPDPRLLSATIAGKVVLVTGAGGSIGSELCRQILALGPKHLVLLELSEYALYCVSESLNNALAARESTAESTGEKFEAPMVTPVLGSVTDEKLMPRILGEHRVHTVYHAAAYKHVPLVESNPVAGAWNNAHGTWVLAKAARAERVETFVLISTDKAVRPTNIMGATKRLAELCLQALAQEEAESNEARTRFLMVRFGNVLGSSGSVIPRFREQIAAGGPVTVTDPRMVRYFMTIPEATQLVIQAAAIGSQTGTANNADVFVLDMGEPVKILDLARNMVRLSGLKVISEEHPEGDIEISFTGIRPGEKLYEELLIGDQATGTEHPRITLALEQSIPINELEDLMARLKDACESLDGKLVREIVGNVAGMGVSDFLCKRD
jgi:FlaA1/EpsC-like NDP-sugar epimerase